MLEAGSASTVSLGQPQAMKYEIDSTYNDSTEFLEGRTPVRLKDEI